MKKLLLALALCFLPTLASAQCSGIFTAGNVCGSIVTGAPKQIPITSFPPFNSALANTFYAGPTSGPAAAPTFRAIVGADLPLPTGATLGAVFSKTAAASNWLRSLGTDGIFTASQPAFTDISGQATLAQFPDIAADTVLGRAAGTTGVPSAMPVPNCSGALNYSTSTHLFSCNTASIPAAPDNVANCSLAAAVAGNALTISLKDQSGADPSALSPCQVAFRDSTAATGTYTTITVTSALSFATGTSGSTFGSVNSVPFRLWITAWNNAGTLVLGVSKQSTAVSVFPINEGVVQSSTACNACTNAATSGVYYTTAAQTSKAIRILGYMEWSAGLATAGTWASGPTNIQMFGSGVYKPGQNIATYYVTAGAADSTSNTYTTSITPPTAAQGKAAVTTASISATSTANLWRVHGAAVLGGSTNSQSVVAYVIQGATGNALSTGFNFLNSNTYASVIPVAYQAVTSSISATSFQIYFSSDANPACLNSKGAVCATVILPSNSSTYIQVEEIQG